MHKTVTILNHIAISGSYIHFASPFFADLFAGKQAYFPELQGKKGVLFSNAVLEKFMEDEFLHDKDILSQEAHRSIRTFSSGERKKALLAHLLKQNPDFIILDNPFDALDVASVETLKEQLSVLAKQITLIQIFKRNDDLLAQIQKVMRVEEDRVVFYGSVPAYLKEYAAPEPFVLNGAIPQPPDQFHPDTESLVRFVDVSVCYEERPILNKICWEVQAGEFWQLKGPNGSGKTTLLTMINGDNPKAYGQEVYLFGRRKGSGENVWQIKKKVGYFTPAMMDLFKGRYTAQQMVVSGLFDSIGLYRKASAAQLHLAGEWLGLMQMGELIHVPFQKLSQVHKRMVLIARAMIKHPPLLILDEPSTGLDDYSAGMLSTLINAMAAEQTTAILYVSHREEPGLKPDNIFVLEPGEAGSVGRFVIR